MGRGRDASPLVVPAYAGIHLPRTESALSLISRSVHEIGPRRGIPLVKSLLLRDAAFRPRRQHARVNYYVYILANRRNGALYVGVTNDLVRRVYQHREGLVDGFTRRYGIKTLVWFDFTGDVLAAIAREKQLKNWKRTWKIELIERENPSWRDLYPSILG